MKKVFHISYKILILAVIVLLTSCVSQKKIRYFQDRAELDTVKTEFINNRAADYKIQPGDNLYVRVQSIDNSSSGFADMRMSTNYYTEEGIYLNSYSVSDSGYIEFPLIGKIHVLSSTINEVRRLVQAEVDEYVKNTIVLVKLVNFKLTMLGEFNRPGKYLVYQDRITIFQAIAMAGDMTDYAKRSELAIIRQTDKGSKLVRLDLNDQNILESDYYYLMPNDIIYVEPLKSKQYAFTQFPYALLLSTVTVLVVLLTFLQN